MSGSSFDFALDVHLGRIGDGSATCFGWLTALSGLGGLALHADTTIQTPLPGKKTVSVVALLRRFVFNGGTNSPIRFDCCLSSHNAAMVAERMLHPLSTTSVQVSWEVWCFDRRAKSWYEACQPAAVIAAPLDTVNGELQIGVDTTADRDVPSMYRFGFQLFPPPHAATIQFAYAAALKAVKVWGGSA